ncbi:MAG TPA: cytochrome c peroxidase [Sphingobacteriaceae bacterium]
MIRVFLSLACCIGAMLLLSSYDAGNGAYQALYRQKVLALAAAQDSLQQQVKASGPVRPAEVREALQRARRKLKAADFWLRYLEPIAYKQLNGPLPVEWETEVFEKFEAPYRRDGAGLTLAGLYLNEPDPAGDSLLNLIRPARAASDIFLADSITGRLATYHHFYLCNRLFLLNLAAIYTTGFECPDREDILPELLLMLNSTGEIYTAFNASFPSRALPRRYLDLFAECARYVGSSDRGIDGFDHLEFIQRYVNPLFAMNQELIRQYRVIPASYNDYSLNNAATSVFDKALFEGMPAKGVYYAIRDERILGEIRETGKLLFFDPILSGNNQRSCASCHKPDQLFTDTTVAAALRYDRQGRLPRNTPSLVNVIYNHLVNADGKHFDLQNQGKDVISNPDEMGADPDEVLAKVMSIGQYRNAFRKFSKLAPNAGPVSLKHITSAITWYYAGFSRYYSPFDEAMNQQLPVHPAVRSGFNLFMGKAGCGTCHFVPGFNGVKPPYTNSEFEVLGTPADHTMARISADKGRYLAHPVPEMLNAFRTGTVRNAPFTGPYMHNGSFATIGEVLEFYNNGGGKGVGLRVDNQTLAPDSLKLTQQEKNDLIAFIFSLNEKIPAETPPAQLPASSSETLKGRKVGGEY